MSHEAILACHGYSFEEHPEAFDMYLFTGRANSLGSGITFLLHGRLANDMFTCEKNYCQKPKFELNCLKFQLFV